MLLYEVCRLLTRHRTAGLERERADAGTLMLAMGLIVLLGVLSGVLR